MDKVADIIFIAYELGIRVARILIALIVTSGIVKMIIDIRKDGEEK